MKRYRKNLPEGTKIFIGIDLHKNHWHITMRTEEIELFSGSIPGTMESLYSQLEPYIHCDLYAVYEAGCFGFWLYDDLSACGVKVIVTPPSLIPVEQGNRVKTDRKDSKKLSHLLSKELLKEVYVLTPEERFHRTVIRRRRQLVRERVRIQHQITSELTLYGIPLKESSGAWSKSYSRNLRSIRFENRYMQESFQRLLDGYDYFCELVKKQTQLVKELAETETYRDRVKLLVSIPGVGVLTAMEILVELSDIRRFARPEQLAAYVGLTPSEHSSGDNIRMGRITKTGKSHLRGQLIEAAWITIRKDKSIEAIYNRIKVRAGGKRAIVAVARHLLLRVRKMLIQKCSYQELLNAA